MYILLGITIFLFCLGTEFGYKSNMVKFHTIIFGNICLYVNLHVPIGSPTQILPSSYCKYTNHSFPSGHRREKYNKYSCCKHLLLFSRGTVQVLLSNTLDHFINFLLGLRWASWCKHLLLFSRGTVQVLLSNTLDHFINFLLGLRWASCCKHLLLFSRGTVQVLSKTLVHYQISGRGSI